MSEPDDRAPDGRRIVPISALQHYAYCPRQCALIHIEQTFDDNIFTLRGTLAHQRVHELDAEQRPHLRIQRGLTLYSDALALVGQADVVELHYATPGGPITAIVPDEHKLASRGSRQTILPDEIQLCAQALCLEAMFGVSIPEGALFQSAPHRRRTVALTPALRATTLATIEATRALLDAVTALPPPAADARCRACSLLDACMPFALKKLNALVAASEDRP